MSNYKQNQGGKGNALADYIEVNERIIAFYNKYPDGSIQTEIISIDEERVVVKAFAYRDREDTRPSTGHAEEIRSASYINKTSALENCETSAVGRALALLGFHVKKSIASREEVANAIAQQEKIKEQEKEEPQPGTITQETAGLIKVQWLKLKYKLEALNPQLMKLYGVTIESMKQEDAQDFLDKLHETERQKASEQTLQGVTQ